MLIHKNFTGQGSGDDTAMNGITLGCDKGNKLIFSGIWGNWGNRFNCPGGFTGAKFKYEDKQVRRTNKYVKDCGLQNLKKYMIISFPCLYGWLYSSLVEMKN